MTEGPASAGEQRRGGLASAEAEQLLDWLQGHGIQGRLLLPEGEGTFTVCWQEPEPGPRRCRRRHRRPCPACDSTRLPYVRREMAPLSWVLLGLGVVFWPLLLVGLLLRRDVWRCWDCHRALGRGRLTLGW